MTALLERLTRRDEPVDVGTWSAFLDRVARRKPWKGEAAAVLASLSTAMPDELTLTALFDALAERGRDRRVDYPGTVNIVGTGGGPRTFHVSTAAAVVAAAMGVRVIKTGSRAHTSQFGSFDLLDRIGVRLASSHAELSDALGRFGVGFAGFFVYPPEIAVLAREILPLDLRSVGRFVTTVGPFLPEVDVPAQLTGVSCAADVPALRVLARRVPHRRTWLCGNELAADELLAFTSNTVHRTDADCTVDLDPLCAGALSDLAPEETHRTVGHFRSVIAGTAAPAAVGTVCLNAAALGVLSGLHGALPDAVADAHAAVSSGAATDLLDRMARHRA